MAELSRQQRAGITRRARTRDAFLDAVTDVFTDSDYRGIQVGHIVNHTYLGTPTFYNTFTGKAAWGAAVLDRRLNEALDKQAAAEAGTLRTPRDRALGHLVLLGEVTYPLPGITQALVDERITAQAPYGKLLPRYYSEVTQAFQDGQEQRDFRGDMEVAEMADFALDSLAMAHAVHLDNIPTRTLNLPSIILDSLSFQ